jgi:hypothetical protein
MSVTISNLTATWVNTAVEYTAIKMNVANNGSAAGSKLMDLQANGTSIFTVYANGSTTIGGTDVLTTIDNRVTPAFNKANVASGQTIANATVDISSNKYTFDASQAQNFVANFDRRAKVVGGSVQYAPKTITFIGNTGSVATATLTLPAGLQQGDLVLLVQGSDDGTPTTPSGWTQIVAGRDGAGVGYGLAYKLMGATPDSSVTVINAGNAPSIAVAYRGVDQTTPVEVTSTLTATVSTPTPTAITPLTDGSEVVGVGWIDDDNVNPVTAPTGFDTSTLAFQPGSTAGFTVMSASRMWPASELTPGAFGGGTDDTEAISIALKPASNQWVVDLPSGMIANDVVFMMVTGSSVIPSAPSGWTDTGYSVQQTGEGGTTGKLFYKVMGSTPDSNVSVTTQSPYTTASLIAVRNIDVDGPINAATIGTSGQTNDPVPGAVIPSNNHSFILAGGYIEARSPTAAVTTPTPNVAYLQSANTAEVVPFSTFIEGIIRDFNAGVSYNPADLNDGATAWIPSTAALAWEWTVALNTRPPQVEFINIPETGFGYIATLSSQNYTDFVEWPQSVLFASSVPGGGANGWPLFTSSSGAEYRFNKFDAIQYATGQELDTTAGTLDWIVPANVSTISAVAVGAGGGGLLQSTGGGGGGGGDLRYSTQINVTPGETLRLLVGEAGTTGAVPTSGGFSSISRANGQVLLLAAGGGAGRGPTLTSGSSNGTSSTIPIATGLTYNYYTIGSVVGPTTEAGFNALFDTATISPTVTFGGTGTHSLNINWGDAGQTGAGGVVGSKPVYLPADQFSWSVEGFILAPETGTYTFGVDSDDGSDVHVNGVNVANFYGPHGFFGAWTGGANQNSNTIYLQAGQFYSFRARMQDGAVNDGIQVGWRKPSDSSIGLIPASVFFTSIPVGLDPFMGGGNGGLGGAGAASGSSGGGGAGGYNGSGGDGAGGTATNGSAAATGSGGGGGGASGDVSNDRSGAGGGVSVVGIGADGTGGVYAAPTGGDGVAGSSGSSSLFGGGAGSSDNTGTLPTGAGRGAIRIIWGKDTDGETNRAYPSTGVASATPRFAFNYILRATADAGYRISYY